MFGVAGFYVCRYANHVLYMSVWVDVVCLNVFGTVALTDMSSGVLGLGTKGRYMRHAAGMTVTQRLGCGRSNIHMCWAILLLSDEWGRHTGTQSNVEYNGEGRFDSKHCIFRYEC